MSVVFYLAWVNEGVTFSAGTHATTATKIWDGTEGGERVFSLAIEHSEGEFPSLTAELINPRVGLLSAGRNQWIWLSADEGAGPQPLFNGRIVGVPQKLANEIVEVEFVARPPDFIALKEALAESLRVLPWFDPVWIQEGADDADTVLEAYPLRYHIDRTTLAVTVSDINDGEDGTMEIGEADHFYDDFEAGYTDGPLRRVSISGTVSWTQEGAGDVDLTRQVCQEFIDTGSPYPSPFVSSLTGDGLLSDWPEPLADIGGGWSMAQSSSIEEATWIEPKSYVVHYGDRADDVLTPFSETALTEIDLLLGTREEEPPPVTYGGSPPITASTADTSDDPFGNWEAAFTLGNYKINFVVHYDASRDRSETVIATVEADVQPLLTDPGAAETETIELSSSFAGESVDTAGSPPAPAIPIDDLRRNSYFKTDRGAQSFEYLLLLARAKLLARARAVEIKLATPWSVASAITCRKNVHLTDNRLPGGEATGKVTAYTLAADGEGEIGASITIGCTIGYGVALAAAATGTPTYVEDGYVNDNYQQRTGAETELLTGELLYQSFDDFEVTDDDGVDLFNMTAANVVNSLTVAGGVFEQKAAVNDEADLPATAMPDPVAALGNVPTVVTLDLVPVEGGPFNVEYDVEVSQLVVPQGIDLEAA